MLAIIVLVAFSLKRTIKDANNESLTSAELSQNLNGDTR